MRNLQQLNIPFYCIILYCSLKKVFKLYLLTGKSTDVPFCFICFSDALHTYFGLCGLSLMEEPGLNAIHAALNITQRAANHLKKLQNQTIS